MVRSCQNVSLLLTLRIVDFGKAVNINLRWVHYIDD